MKRIGILSDTHGYWDDRYAHYFADCDEIWHAGDIGHAEIIDRLAEICTVRAVSGNVDHGEVRRRFRELEIFEVEWVRVLLTHIGGYPGKWASGMRELLARENIKLMVDGHSHLLKIMPDNKLNLLHINPGAAGIHGWQTVHTLVRLTIDNGEMRDAEVIELAPGK